MRAGGVIVAVGVTGLAVWGLSKLKGGIYAARVANNAMVRIIGIKNLKVGMVGIMPALKFNLQIECTNPTGQRATFDTFAINLQEGEARIGSNVWATVRYNTPVVMEPRELTKVVEIPTTVNLGGAALNVLVGPSVQTILNRIASKNKAKKAAAPTKAEPMQGVGRFVSFEEMQYVAGLGATNPDEINLLKNIKAKLPKQLNAVGNVRVNTILLPINEVITLS